ncbi:MAG: hypothetical protein JJU45_08885 [Acidimicrobiia bacterium]|nr:hypothetical protein [Acidimicrobiia bacterium]
MDVRQMARDLQQAEPADQERLLEELFAHAPDTQALDPGPEALQILDRYLGLLGAVRQRLRRYRADPTVLDAVDAEMDRWHDQRDVVMLYLLQQVDEPSSPGGGPVALSARPAPNDVRAVLVAVGARLGLSPVTPAEQADLRVDVCWRWEPPGGLPGLAEPLPVVGFVLLAPTDGADAVKAAVLDLVDLGCAQGVLVDPGDPSVRSTTDEGDTKGAAARRRSVARIVAARPGPELAIWTAAEVEALHTSVR